MSSMPSTGKISLTSVNKISASPATTFSAACTEPGSSRVFACTSAAIPSRSNMRSRCGRLAPSRANVTDFAVSNVC